MGAQVTPKRVVAFVGGPILTMAPGPEPEALVCVGERIAEVGERGCLERHPDAEVIDLRGRALAPGLIDAHCHLSIAALSPRWGDASTADDVDGIVAAIRAAAAAEPDADWVRVAGWDDARGVVPTRADLDAAGVDRPVVVASYTLHEAVVSSAALDALGIGRSTPDPPGGEIGRDTTGRPDGRLVERAWGAAHARSLAAYADPDRWAQHIASAAAGLLATGITAIHDAACSPAAEECYRAMAVEGNLPVSVLAMPHSATLLDNDPGDRLDGPVTGEGDDRFRIGPVKLFADGGVAIAVDAAIGGHAIRWGTSFPDVIEHARVASDRGFRVAVHALGNAGVDLAIEAARTAVSRRSDDDHRPRVEHAGLASPAQARRLAEMGAVAVVQPGFVEHLAPRAGMVRFDEHRWLPFADLAAAGVALAGSSDHPCAPFDPMWGARLGASRHNTDGLALEPDQGLDPIDWLHAYTAGAAHAGGQEHERGVLAPGRRADLVVLDVPPRGAVPRVLETWVGAVRVFDGAPVPPAGGASARVPG